ncbi:MULTISPECIES: EAL and HDOD domain-containing protein [unclassified Agarivorans]|uniref:EAL and HDOD domain-containing protein n=1 Tax=unclassified Agarivorans TaxID=2636026 RepID=UPI003D7D928D
MNVYTARQAILDRRQRVAAYELLFRDGPENVFPNIDPHEATSRLIIRTQLNQGLQEITQGRPALINFSEDSLYSDIVCLLPKQQVVIEILESAKPSKRLYKRCQYLVRSGYRLALDDFIYHPEWEPFFKLVCLIKIDIRKTPLNQLGSFFAVINNYKSINLLAEKIETQQEYQQARALGFSLFQGFYFCRPEMRQSKELDASYQVISRLFHATSKDEVNVNEVVGYFERDTSLAYKLLRYVNSSHQPIVRNIVSIKQAVVYVGNAQLRKLVAILANAMTVSHKPRELMRMSLHRARFCELVANRLSQVNRDSAFLCGLFSLLDAILDKPLSEILGALPLDQDIKAALCSGQSSVLGIMLLTIKSYEQGNWALSESLAQQLEIDYLDIEQFNLQALLWSEEFQSLLSPTA